MQKLKTIAAYDFKCSVEEINRETHKKIKGRAAKKKGIYEKNKVLYIKKEKRRKCT